MCEEMQRGQQRRGKTWYQFVDSDLRSLKIDRDRYLAQNLNEWKIAIKKPV